MTGRSGFLSTLHRLLSTCSTRRHDEPGILSIDTGDGARRSLVAECAEEVVRRMDLVGLSLAVAIGFFVGVQPAINGRLGQFTGQPALAALISTLTSTTCLLIYCLILRPELPTWGVLRTGPWWMWTGGLIGAVYVAVSLNLVQRLGATVLVAVVLVGQMIAALIVDHYGLFGLPESPITVQRLLGVGFLIAGVALIRWF